MAENIKCIGCNKAIDDAIFRVITSNGEEIDEDKPKTWKPFMVL